MVANDSNPCCRKGAWVGRELSVKWKSRLVFHHNHTPQQPPIRKALRNLLAGSLHWGLGQLSSEANSSQELCRSVPLTPAGDRDPMTFMSEEKELWQPKRPLRKAFKEEAKERRGRKVKEGERTGGKLEEEMEREKPGSWKSDLWSKSNNQW